MCFSYDLYRPHLFDTLLPVIDAIEICPDTISYSKNGKIFLDERIMEQLQSVNGDKKILIHGVGLSIGSHDSMNQHYIGLLDDLFERLSITWHSEHLAYCQVDGQNLNTMLTVPRTDEALALISARVQWLANRYKVPFLLENIANLLPTREYDYSLPQFLNNLQRSSGCGLILDIYNLECDEYNYHTSAQNHIDEINLQAVKEIHIAGGPIESEMKLDVHSRRVAENTLDLTGQVLQQDSGIEVVTFELLPEAYELYTPEELAQHIHYIRERIDI